MDHGAVVTMVARSAPAVLTLCPAADEPWVWTVLRIAPTPAAQRRLSPRRLDRLLREHRIRRLTAAQVYAVLQQPAFSPAPGVADAVATHLQLLIPRVELVTAQRRDAERQLERWLDALDQEPAAPGDQREHSDVAIVRSMPGVGTRVAAPTSCGRRLGLAPVTKQSGTRRHVVMRTACNRRLRTAVYHWARTGMQHDPASRTYYQTLRARGHTHGRALRSVADRLLRILMTLLTRGHLFDPGYGQAALAPAPGGA